MGTKRFNKGSLEVVSVNEGGAGGRVMVFTGPGRGKTIAALGVAVRTIAHGGRVIFVHFTGPRYPVLGEVKTAVQNRLDPLS